MGEPFCVILRPEHCAKGLVFFSSKTILLLKNATHIFVVLRANYYHKNERKVATGEMLPIGYIMKRRTLAPVALLLAFSAVLSPALGTSACAADEVYEAY